MFLLSSKLLPICYIVYITLIIVLVFLNIVQSTPRDTYSRIFLLASKRVLIEAF